MKSIAFAFLNLFATIQAAGARVYDGEGSPLWEPVNPDELSPVNLGAQTDGSIVSLAQGEYGHSLMVVKGDQRVYVPIVGDVGTSTEFEVGEFAAVRDFEDGGIYAGDPSFRARPKA